MSAFCDSSCGYKKLHVQFVGPSDQASQTFGRKASRAMFRAVDYAIGLGLILLFDVNGSLPFPGLASAGHKNSSGKDCRGTTRSNWLDPQRWAAAMLAPCRPMIVEHWRDFGIKSCSVQGLNYWRDTTRHNLGDFLLNRPQWFRDRWVVEPRPV